jgi:hypothetical protein
MMTETGDFDVVAVTQFENGFTVAGVEDSAVDGDFDGAERAGGGGEH